MTPTEQKRLLLCKQTLEQLMAKNKSKKLHYQAKLDRINLRLRDPVTPEVNTGEHEKKDNPFEK